MFEEGCVVYVGDGVLCCGVGFEMFGYVIFFEVIVIEVYCNVGIGGEMFDYGYCVGCDCVVE